MSTTVQWVYDRAIHLMDEQHEASGDTVFEDTAEYRHRTISILNVLRHELYPISDTYQPGGPPRSVCPELTAFSDEIGLDDAVAQGILPYGLAAHLLLGEHNVMANFFFQRYQAMYQALRSALPAVWEDVPLRYGGVDV